MTGRDVVEVVVALRSAGSTCVLAGGWGVDALVGRRTRRHADLDLAVDDGSPAPATAAGRALEAIGFGLVRCDVLPGAYFADRRLYEDRWGRLVDLHPAHVGLGDDRAALPGVPVLDGGSVVTGTVGGRPVACLSAGEQSASRRGYPPRDVDRRDLRLLGVLARPRPGSPLPAGDRSGHRPPEREGGGDVPPSLSLP